MRVTAQRKALAAAYGMLQAHASVLSFVEAFWSMGGIFLGMLPFLLLNTVNTPPNRLLPYLRHRPRKKRSCPAKNTSPNS